MWRPHLPSLSLVAGEATRTARRFPWVVGSSVTAAAYASWLVGFEHYEADFVRVMFPLVLGIPLFLAVALYREQPSRPIPFAGIWLDLAALAGLVLYFRSVADDGTKNAWTRFAQLHLAAMQSVAFAAFTARGQENGFWQFNRERFFRFILSSVYAGVCFIGLVIALNAVNKLFDVKFDRAYPRLWFACAFILLPWHFLASIPKSLAALDKDRLYPAPLRLFGQYLLMPLVLLYAVILFAYMGKIVWTHEWPEGLVAWMVSGMSIFGVLVLLLLHPFQRVRGQTWIRMGGRWFYALILPLLLMHLTALGKRIGQYGFTEHRYILLLLAVWLGGLSLSFLTGLAKNIKVVPMSLCALALITFVGPWSAYAVSRRSQQHRLSAILARKHLIVGHDNRKAGPAVTLEDYNEISNLLRYLFEYHGARSLAPYQAAGRSSHPVPRHADRYRGASDQEQLTGPILASLGLGTAPIQRPKSDSHFSFSARESTDDFVPVSGYDGLITLRYSLDQEFSDGAKKWKTHLERDGRTLLLSLGGKPAARFDLLQIAIRLLNKRGTSDDRVPFSEMSATAEADGDQFCLRLHELNGRLEQGRPRIFGGSGFLLIKRKVNG